MTNSRRQGDSWFLPIMKNHVFPHSKHGAQDTAMPSGTTQITTITGDTNSTMNKRQRKIKPEGSTYSHIQRMIDNIFIFKPDPQYFAVCTSNDHYLNQWWLSPALHVCVIRVNELIPYRLPPHRQSKTKKENTVVLCLRNIINANIANNILMNGILIGLYLKIWCASMIT